MPSLIEHVEQAITAQALWRDGQRILVAVSGGVDSMVMLHALHRLAPVHRWPLVVAHFNHRLRGRSSDADERFVRATAQSLGWRFVAGRAEAGVINRRRGESVEMAARALRHAFLARTARRLGVGVVALAHHADDQVELFFLRFLRGAGPEGLSGMRWKNSSPGDARVTLARPLLACTRQDIEQYARRMRVQFREDASNACRDILRNRIRHELLPRLVQRYQPALARTTRRVMDLLRAESEFLAQAADAWLRRKRRPAFARLPVAVQRQVVHLQLTRMPDVEADFELVEKLRQTANVPVTVAPHLALARNSQGALHRVAASTVDYDLRQQRLRLGKHGQRSFAGVDFAWVIEPRAAGRPLAIPTTRRDPGVAVAREGSEWFDAGKVGPRIVLRHWQPGDRFQPIGMAQAVKLQDWFTNRKVPRAQRRQLVIATTAQGEIFWVEGQRIGERFKLAHDSTRRLRWRWQRHPTLSTKRSEDSQEAPHAAKPRMR